MRISHAFFCCFLSIRISDSEGTVTTTTMMMMRKHASEYVRELCKYLEELAVLSKGGFEADGERKSRLAWNCCCLEAVVGGDNEGRGESPQRGLDRLVPSGVADHREKDPVSGVLVGAREDSMIGRGGVERKEEDGTQVMRVTEVVMSCWVGRK